VVNLRAAIEELQTNLDAFRDLFPESDEQRMLECIVPFFQGEVLHFMEDVTDQLDEFEARMNGKVAGSLAMLDQAQAQLDANQKDIDDLRNGGE